MQAVFDFLTRFFEELKPWATVLPWEASLRTRFGKYFKSFGPGVHFRIPMFDSYHTLNVVPRVVNLPHQSLETTDGKTLAVSGALAYSVSDVEKVLVEVDDHDESLVNLAMGLIAYYVSNHDAASCGHDAVQSGVIPSLRDVAAEWGIEVSHLYITDLCKHKAYRLLHDNNPPKTAAIVNIV